MSNINSTTYNQLNSTKYSSAMSSFPTGYKRWVFNYDIRNCSGNLCPPNTLCMRPEYSYYPTHCVHINNVDDVDQHLSNGPVYLCNDGIAQYITQGMLVTILIVQACRQQRWVGIVRGIGNRNYRKWLKSRNSGIGTVGNRNCRKSELSGIGTVSKVGTRELEIKFIFGNRNSDPPLIVLCLQFFWRSSSKKISDNKKIKKNPSLCDSITANLELLTPPRLDLTLIRSNIPTLLREGNDQPAINSEFSTSKSTRFYERTEQANSSTSLFSSEYPVPFAPYQNV
ncbi:unnamed protein product [Meloidogyne enterolobii]|uniref:Uncharacterized protein n=1 Tax=Meloidogyne enterolobii TaxID=390850 RepID=A0ACB1ASG1_MELEN